MTAEGPKGNDEPTASPPGVRLARIYVGSIVFFGILVAIDGEPIPWLYGLGAFGILGAYMLFLYLLDRRSQT